VNDLASKTLTLKTSEDVVRMRQAVRERAIELGFGLVDQTKLVTAASELARNTILYGGGGEVLLEVVTQGDRRGICLTFSDRGPGIPNIELALKDGYTSGSGLGLGLGGAKRLSNEFNIVSQVGGGTRVTIKRWR
jgi:serine/threonine-protein kinase RsbT